MGQLWGSCSQVQANSEDVCGMRAGLGGKGTGRKVQNWELENKTIYLHPLPPCPSS